MLFGKTKCPPLHAFHFYEHARFFYGKKKKKMSCKALTMSSSDLGLCLTPPCRPFIGAKLTPPCFTSKTSTNGSRYSPLKTSHLDKCSMEHAHP